MPQSFDSGTRPSFHIMNTKHLFAAAFVASVGFTSAFAGGEGWTQDLAAAKKQAAEEKKDLLLDFTGSDWCPPCIALTKDILSKEEFRTATKDKFILVELDFPREEENVEKQGEEVRARNEALSADYGIKGYPTVILTDASGKPYAYTGFRPGGPEDYVTHLDELRKQGETLKTSVKKADDAKSADDAKTLVEALKEIPEPAISKFYPEVVAQIKKADPKDETGFTKKLAASEQMAAFEKEMQGFAEKEDMDGALAYIEKSLATGKFEGENKQQLLLMKTGILANTGKFEEAIKLIDEAKAAAPESEIAGQLDGFKSQLEAAKSGKLPQQDGGEEEEEGDAEK